MSFPPSPASAALSDDPVAAAVERALSPEVGEELVQRMAEGDVSALEALHQLCGGRFYSMARHLVRDDGAAREIVQDCLLKVWKRAATYDAAASRPFTWCVMILRGLCLDHLRRTYRRLPGPPADALAAEPAHHPPLADLHLHETLHLVRYSLARLTPGEQEAIQAALFEPATCEELAERWDMPVGSVKTRIYRAMQKLRHLLRPQLSR